MCDQAWEAIITILRMEPKQAVIVRHLADGYTVKEVSRLVGRSPNTVYSHLKRVCEQLKLDGPEALVAMVHRTYRELRIRRNPPFVCGVIATVEEHEMAGVEVGDRRRACPAGLSVPAVQPAACYSP